MAYLWFNDYVLFGVSLNNCIYFVGPIVCFESLLSLHGEDVTIFNDMIVAVEDLRNVEFTLVIVDNKPTQAHFQEQESNKPSTIPLLECHTFPLPRVTGSRNNLKVMIPVPNYILTQIPIEELKHLSFSVTPVLFNIGINEHATLAGKFGNNGPQVSIIKNTSIIMYLNQND